MGKGTAISWATDTFNLWWGCEHAPADDPTDPAMVDMTVISEECRNCYAETFDKRVGGEHWGPGAEPRWFGDAYWAKLRRWNTEAREAGVRRRVFVASMADWAQRHRDPAINAKMDAVRARLWGEVLACPWLDFLMLTKRADRLTELLPWYTAVAPGRMPRDDAQAALNEPWSNVWVGVTAGTRRSLWRVRKLREVRAAVRFVSCEPLLEHITAEDWDRAIGSGEICTEGCGEVVRYQNDGDTGYASCGCTVEGAEACAWSPDLVHWLIIGDESGGTKASPRRPVDLDAVRTARDAADRHGVAFHLKQLHEGGRKVHLPMLDQRRHAAFPEAR